MEILMIWIAVTAAVLLLISAVTVYLLFYFGLINSYHPENKAKDGQIKVACVGDSITYGCMVRNRRKNNYPQILSGLAGEKYCVNNFGYTDRTAIKSADLPFVKEKLYKQSLEFNPDIVFILLGSNDSKVHNWDKDKFISDYGEIIDSYLNLSASPEVYVITPPPVLEVGKKVLYKLRKDVIENEICPLVQRIAEMKGVECVDISVIFKNRKDLFADGVHPNAKGCKALAQKIFDVLQCAHL